MNVSALVLPDLLEEWSTLADRWRRHGSETARLKMQGAWHVAITHPGAWSDTGAADDGTPGGCVPTVLIRDTGDDDNHLSYRGACLGCGWVATEEHLIWATGENGAAEDANDHGFPGWRDLPVVERPPGTAGGAAGASAAAQWHKRWGGLLPAGWLDRGGPIRTARSADATRHVPGGAPGGGYDMSAGTHEVPGGQLALFA
jgi:hypothetical protein